MWQKRAREDLKKEKRQQQDGLRHGEHGGQVIGKRCGIISLHRCNQPAALHVFERSLAPAQLDAQWS